MKSTSIIQGITILFVLWHCEAASTYSSRQANRKQKKLIEGCVDLQANACDDFYKYACGNWDQVHLEAGTKYYEPITMLDYNVNQELAHVFNRFRFIRNKPKFIREAYNYYKSCKNLGKFEPIEYLTWLKDNDGFEWPAIWTKPKNTTQFDWVTTLGKMRSYGLNDVFIQQIDMSRIRDVRNSIIDLDKPVMDGGFQPMTKTNLEILILSMPGQMTTDEFNRLWQEIAEFEQQLKDLDAIEDISIENETDYEQQRLFLFKNLPLDWLKDYVKIMLNQTTVSDDMPLYIQNIPYMNALDALLQQYSQRFLCKYLEIRFLLHLYKNGPTNSLAEECVSSTRSLMPVAMHWQYEQQHPELQNEYSAIYDIFNDMRRLFNNTVIRNKHGFNATVLQYLQNKLTHMKLRLNNVPRVDTVETLEKFYQPLSLDAGKFYANHLKLLRHNFVARLNLLNNQKPVLDYTYLENAKFGCCSVPYFVPNFNTVFVPLTLLQHPIYSPGLDDIYKYSSLGFVLAHEMFHGFDESGLLTDANGSMTFMEFEENPLFNASFNCLLEINPNVIGEKIADISGLRYAYRAFFDSNPEAASKNVSLYGSDISLGKLFFLNFAQFFCGNASEEFVFLSEHGSDRERVMDALSHFPEFSKEFKCSRNHRLYPHETCHLWR